MVIAFIGNNFKYEIEAVTKLFLPLQSFEFLFEEIPDSTDNFCIVLEI